MYQPCYPPGRLTWVASGYSWPAITKGAAFVSGQLHWSCEPRSRADIRMRSAMWECSKRTAIITFIACSATSPCRWTIYWLLTSASGARRAASSWHAITKASRAHTVLQQGACFSTAAFLLQTCKWDTTVNNSILEIRYTIDHLLYISHSPSQAFREFRWDLWDTGCRWKRQGWYTEK